MLELQAIFSKFNENFECGKAMCRSLWYFCKFFLLVLSFVLTACERNKTEPVLEFDKSSVYYSRLPVQVREFPVYDTCGDVVNRAWREKFPPTLYSISDYSVTQEYCTTLTKPSFFNAVTIHTRDMGCKPSYQIPARLFLKCNGSVKGTVIATYIIDTLEEEARVHVFFTSKQIDFRKSVNFPPLPNN